MTDKNKHKDMTLNEKLDLILKNQEKILEKEDKIYEEEKSIEEKEDQALKLEEKAEEDEKQILEELKGMEGELKKSSTKPLTKVTKRDVVKGFVGAFVGVVSHFAFTKAPGIADMMGFWESTILYIFSFIMIVLLLYYTGFRYIQKRVVLRFMPLRALVLYIVSFFTVILVNVLFGILQFPTTFMDVYSTVGANMVLAVMGAGTADLIGREA